MRIAAGIAIAVALSVAASAGAQKSPEVAQISVWKVKPGATAAFEAGRARHMAFHAAQKDSWSWFTWEVVNGDRAGEYLTGSFNHFWKDFDGRDAFDKLDNADVEKNLGANSEVTTTGYWTYMTEASRAQPGTTGPAAYAQLTHYMVNPADTPRFEDALKEIKADLDKAEWPVYSAWYRLSSGGEGPHYVVSTRRDNFAAFAPLDKSLIEAVAGVAGPRRAAELFDIVRSSTRSVYTEVLKLRSDLSYVAPAAK